MAPAVRRMRPPPGLYCCALERWGDRGDASRAVSLGLHRLTCVWRRAIRGGLCTGLRGGRSWAPLTQPKHVRTHRGSECAVARGQVAPPAADRETHHGAMPNPPPPPRSSLLPHSSACGAPHPPTLLGVKDGPGQGIGAQWGPVGVRVGAPPPPLRWPSVPQVTGGTRHRGQGPRLRRVRFKAKAPEGPPAGEGPRSPRAPNAATADAPAGADPRSPGDPAAGATPPPPPPQPLAPQAPMAGDEGGAADGRACGGAGDARSATAAGPTLSSFADWDSGADWIHSFLSQRCVGPGTRGGGGVWGGGRGLPRRRGLSTRGRFIRTGQNVW